MTIVNPTIHNKYLTSLKLFNQKNPYVKISNQIQIVRNIFRLTILTKFKSTKDLAPPSRVIFLNGVETQKVF